MADDVKPPVAARRDAAGATVGAPFVHEMFHTAYDMKPGDAAFPQIFDEARVVHRFASEDARRDRRFSQKYLDPLQQLLHHDSP
jgi:hypothetical protein